MNRTVTPCLSRRLSSACRTCLVKSSEIGLVSSSYRSGATRFLTRVRGVWPSLNRILQTVSTRQTLMRLMSSVWIRVVRPFPECLVAGQMPLDLLARPGRVDLTGARAEAAIIRNPTSNDQR